MEAILEAVRAGIKDPIDEISTGNNNPIDELYKLIDEDPEVLERTYNTPLTQTPLHVAAEYGCTHFALELMFLKPSFAEKMNPEGLTPINLAIQKGKTEFVKRLVDVDNKLVQVKGKNGWTPLHHAASTGNIDLLDKFLKVCPQSINNQTVYGENAVHVAAACGGKKALEKLIEWLERPGNDHVLHLKDNEENTVLHTVASNHEKYEEKDLHDVLEMLHKKIADGERNSRGEKALEIILHSQTLTDQQKTDAEKFLNSKTPYQRKTMENLLAAIRKGEEKSITLTSRGGGCPTLLPPKSATELMYELIVEDPDLLERTDNIPLTETLLHVAAEHGCTHFALELMRLKPSLAKKMNTGGLTPINLAVQKEQTEFVERLVHFDNKLVQVKGRDGQTPLHHAAETGNIDLLAKFLMVCPQSINDLTVYGQNAVHVAAKYGKKQALEMLIGWLQRTGNNDVLHLKDHEGDTVLHIVATNLDKYAEDLDDVLKMLHKKIANGEQNSKGQTAEQIITDSTKLTVKQKAATNYKKILRSQSKYSTGTTFADFLRSPEMIFEKVLRFDINMRKNLPIATVNALLVVATLIVTATYQAVLDPPHGLKNPFTRSESDSLEPFLTLNTITFSLAIGIIICLLEVSKSSAPVHFSLVYLYFNYMALVWSRHDSLRPVLLTALTFSINYLIIVGRMSMALFEYKGVARNYFTFGLFSGTVSRLEMQHKAIDSVYSSRQGTRKVLIKL